MRCQQCGQILEPGDEFCLRCGAKIKSYYTDEDPGYNTPGYNNVDYYAPPVQNNKNNTAVYVILAIVGTLLVGCLAWILYNQFHKDAAETPMETDYVAVQTEAPRETVYVTVQPTTAPVVKTGGYLLPESNSRRMTDADLSQLTHEELCFARNEIYARHGRKFDTPQVARYFEGKSWYNGTIASNQFNENTLSDVERANVNIIFDYEKSHYGGSYY